MYKRYFCKLFYKDRYYPLFMRKNVALRRSCENGMMDIIQRQEKEYIIRALYIVCALFDNQLSNYWTSFGPYDEIFYYVRNDIKNIRNDLALMVIGERVNAKIGDFAAVSMELKTKNQIYSAMVIYGLLTYNNGQVFIPNKELMLKYDELLFRES